METAKKTLKFLSRSLAGLFFTVAFLLFFSSLLGSMLVEGMPVLEASLSRNLEELNQDAKTEGQILVDTQGIKQNLQPLANILSSKFIFILMLIFLILSLTFYSLGTSSVYEALFKISMNASLSTLVAYITFSSIPSLLPSLMDQAFNFASADLSQELPMGIKSAMTNAVAEWFKSPLSEINSIFIYLIAATLTLSIIFYFLKRRHSKEEASQ